MALALGRSMLPRLPNRGPCDADTEAGWLWASPLQQLVNRQTARRVLVAECYEHAGFCRVLQWHALPGAVRITLLRRALACRRFVRGGMRHGLHGVGDRSQAGGSEFLRPSQAMLRWSRTRPRWEAVAFVDTHSTTMDCLRSRQRVTTLTARYIERMPPDAGIVSGTLVPTLGRGHIREIVDALERAFGNVDARRR